MFFAEPVRTEADLIEALETADAQHCDLCERNAPHFCLFCFVHRHRELVALATEEQAREKARVDERYKRRMQAEAQKAARAAASRERAAGKTSVASPSDNERMARTLQTDRVQEMSAKRRRHG